jgi:methionine-rich copper-binding protein CopC
VTKHPRSLLALAVAALVLVTPALPATAHSELLQSTPADGERLSEAPSEVELVFGEGVQQQGGAIVVKGPDGSRYDRASTFQTDENVATVQLADASEAGEYTVAYRVVSADGHVVSGSLAYRLLEAGSAPSGAASSSDATPLAGTATDEGTGEDSGGAFIWVLGLGAIGLALLAAMIAVFVRGRRDRRG